MNEETREPQQTAQHGGSRPGAGRPRTPDMRAGADTISAYLSAEDIAYLAKWNRSHSAALRDLIDRARKFWPEGI